MKISTEINSAAEIVGEEKAVEYVAKAGFDCWDFSMFAAFRMDWAKWRAERLPHPLNGADYLGFARKLRHIGEENGITCNQSHAPFPTAMQEIREWYPRALEVTAEAGGRICIIHPDNDSTPEQNAEMYEALLPVAKQYGVKIATENMWNWDAEKEQAAFAACSDAESFVRHIDVMNDPSFVACLDIGHAEMRGLNTSAVEMIRALGDRLQALHIHDNDRWHDSHQIPFSMDIDFVPIVAALKEIGYRGEFTLESGRYMKGLTPEEVPAGLAQMAAAARKLADMFEA